MHPLTNNVIFQNIHTVHPIRQPTSNYIVLFFLLMINIVFIAIVLLRTVAHMTLFLCRPRKVVKKSYKNCWSAVVQVDHRWRQGLCFWLVEWLLIFGAGGIPISSTNKIDRDDATKNLRKNGK